MKPAKTFLPLLWVGLIFSSCVMTDQIRNLQIEIMRPGIFNIPKDLSVEIIHRDHFQSDTCKFYYSNGYFRNHDSIEKYNSQIDAVFAHEATGFGISNKNNSLYETLIDTSVGYSNLSDTCINALVDYFKEEEYFKNVTKSGDSLNHLLKLPGKISTKEELFEKTGSDVCIFLDYLNLNTTYNLYFSTPFKTMASLIWTVAFKTDSLVYSYNQVDTLFYDQGQILTFKKHKDNILSQLVNNSSIYLGNSFGAKMIPNWIQAERMYYKSQNTEMLKAEKYAISQDWLKAAEIWNKQTKNKNDKIAAKACYNMALACEMEGKPDVAIAWLVQSYSSLKKNNDDHKYNCQRYVNVLALRKLEIERLAEQLSQTEINSEK